MLKQKKSLPSVLITGCSSGLGNALARKFVKAGYPTYASARRLESIEDLKREGCYTLRVDVTDHSTIKEAIEIIEKEHQSVGILVNNAAIGIMTPIETISIDEVRKQYETNVFGLLAMTQAVLPAMRKAHKGRIVNIGSSGGEFTTPGGGVYQATKYALTSMNDAMRAELEPFGIFVSMIQPGAIASKFAQNGAVLGYKEEGPYQELMLGINKITSAAVKKGTPGTWTPEQVAKISFKAATKRKPKARYRPGFVAKALIYTRLWMPYRMWDKMFMSMMLKEGKKIKETLK
jgi:NADP-dependent 3-hydroxy acid dehydrogenase YdfG